MKGHGWYSFPPPKSDEWPARVVHFLSVFYNQGEFQSARSFQQHHGRAQSLQLGDQLADPFLVVGDTPPVIRGADGNVQPSLGNINAYVDSFPFHEHLL